ncbi:hypothetical protein, partial [Salmonella sp. s55004]|uniref:hypothetical protein n=1 Tax=Salmonella sp. s55004 TaxID=3159675 RepID=UPI00397F33A8
MNVLELFRPLSAHVHKLSICSERLSPQFNSRTCFSQGHIEVLLFSVPEAKLYGAQLQRSQRGGVWHTILLRGKNAARLYCNYNFYVHYHTDSYIHYHADSY